MDTLRATPFGQTMRLLSRGRLFQYPEEDAAFVVPECYGGKPSQVGVYDDDGGIEYTKEGERAGVVERATPGIVELRDRLRAHSDPGLVLPSVPSSPTEVGPVPNNRLSRVTTITTLDPLDDSEHDHPATLDRMHRVLSRSPNDRSTQLAIAKVPAGSTIVTWYSPVDPANPQNWSLRKKLWTSFIIMFYTFAVYAGSSIIALGIPDVAHDLGVSEIVATLAITMFVAGYAVGPLFLSPLSEVPSIGRNPPYVISLLIFCVLQIPTAKVDNITGLLILRFVAGFMGSPPLATGGATLTDIFSDQKSGYAMGAYGVALGVAPATAPFISGFAIQRFGWRMAFWEMTLISGVALVLLCFGLPETNPDTILTHRAARLRALTGNDGLRAACELAEHRTLRRELFEALFRPMVLTVCEPIVFAIDIYQGLTYAVLYSYFETYPIVFGNAGAAHGWQGYGWGLGLSGLPFIALTIGGVISYAVYVVWSMYWWEPRFIAAKGKLAPEAYLPLSLYGAFCYPICLFWFAWSANRTHWISPTIASGIFGLADCWSFMPYLSYLAVAYPAHTASALASNDFVRSMMGAAMPVVARPLFANMGIDWGNSILGFVSILFIPIPFVLYKYGPWLRARSPRATNIGYNKHVREKDPAAHSCA